MALPTNLDEDKLAEVGLAILSLSAWNEGYGDRAWKSMDWDLLDVLHQRGWISDPVGKQKSVDLTKEGAHLAATYLEKHFGK